METTEAKEMASGGTASEWLRGASEGHEVNYPQEKILGMIRKAAELFRVELLLDTEQGYDDRFVRKGSFLCISIKRPLVLVRTVPGEGLRLRLVTLMGQGNSWRVVNAVNDWLDRTYGPGLPQPPERIVWLPTPVWIHTCNDCLVMPLWESRARELVQRYVAVCNEVLGPENKGV